MQTSTSDIKQLSRWGIDPSENNQVEHTLHETIGIPENKIKFAIRHDLNQKIILWQGAIWQLNVDAIVNTTNENLSERNGVSKGIFEAAGREIHIECMAIESCKTGEAVSTRGCQLLAKRIIHTVGPRYNEKYKNAAENALHCCYRNCMIVAKEDETRSIAFPCIYTRRKFYPREPAAHLALRTIRRFLEHYGNSFDTVVFCLEENEDLVIYQRLLKFYFPRTLDELKHAQGMLPDNVGNEFGEPTIEDRKIRISSFPAFPFDNQVEQQPELPEQQEHQPVAVRKNDPYSKNHDFGDMVDDPDFVRLQNLRKERSKSTFSDQRNMDALERYRHCLRIAQDEDFRDIASLNLIYQAGNDQAGDPVLVYVANRLPATTINLDRVLLYIIQIMNSVVHRGYSVVYIHSNCTRENLPDISWMKRLFKTFTNECKDNMKILSVLHPTLWLKTILWIVKSFIDDSFYKKVHYVNNAHDLLDFAPDLDLPSTVYRQPKSKIASAAVDSQEQL